MTRFDNYVKTIIENITVAEGIFNKFKQTYFPTKNQEKERFTCQDCKRSDYPMYMVNNDIWQQYGVGTNTLCLQCLNKRTGNRLQFRDFSDYMKYPVNQHNPEIQQLQNV